MERVDRGFVETLMPYLLLAVSVGLAVAFLIGPALLSLGYSLQSYNLLHPDRIRFVGLANYIHIFEDRELRQTIANSVYLLVGLIVLTFLGSLAFALVLNRPFAGRQVLLAIVILPWALPQVVNAVLWVNVFSPTYGALNGLLYGLGIVDHYVVWTSGTLTTINLILLALLWKSLPLATVITLAAIQSIPGELYEAARMDGANAFQRLLFITLPSIAPAIAIVLSIASIIALNAFDEIVVIAAFRSDTRSLAMEAYLKAFKFLDLGYGSAIAYVLFFAGAVCSMAYMRNLYREMQK